MEHKFVETFVSYDLIERTDKRCTDTKSLQERFYGCLGQQELVQTQISIIRFEDMKVC